MEELSKNWNFGLFIENGSVKVSNFLHDGRRQWGASLEYGAIFGENLNPGSVRGFSKD